MNEKEMKELTADVVAIVKREREAQAPKYVAGKNKGKEAEDEKTYLHQRKPSNVADWL